MSYAGTIFERLEVGEKMLASDVMTRNVIDVAPDAALDDVVRVLADDRFSAIPVVSADRRLLGLVTRSRLDALDTAGRTAGEVMERAPRTIGPMTSLGAAARTLLGAGARQLLVVDGERLVGIVTTIDLLRGFAQTAQRGGEGYGQA